MTVVQRRAESVPGFDERLWISIGDVTGGQVLVRVHDSAGDVDVVPQTSMRVGDAAGFEDRGHRYAVGVVRIVNFLIGDDFTEFAVGAPDHVATVQIERMLGRIARTRSTFVEGGEEVSGAALAARLRAAWLSRNDKALTAADFIDAVAGGSDPACHVRLAEDREPTLADWLRSQWATAER